jgi:hypothetical protein
MTMTQPIRINPQVLREVADHHDEVVSMLRDARERGGDILAAVESYGPIMHQVKAAVADVLQERADALDNHARRHSLASDELRRAAHIYTNQDDHNARQIETLTSE